MKITFETTTWILNAGRTNKLISVKLITEQQNFHIMKTSYAKSKGVTHCAKALSTSLVFKDVKRTHQLVRKLITIKNKTDCMDRCLTVNESLMAHEHINSSPLHLIRES